MRLDDEFALAPSALHTPPVKLVLTGPVWLYPVARPRVQPVFDEDEGRVIVIHVGDEELGVKYKLSKDVRK